MTLSLESYASGYERMRPLREMLFDRFFDGVNTPQVTLEEAPLANTVAVRVYDPAINLALRYGFHASVLRGLDSAAVLDAVGQGLDVLEMQWRQARFYARLRAFALPLRREGVWKP